MVQCFHTCYYKNQDACINKYVKVSAYYFNVWSERNTENVLIVCIYSNVDFLSYVSLILLIGAVPLLSEYTFQQGMELVS